MLMQSIKFSKIVMTGVGAQLTTDTFKKLNRKELPRLNRRFEL